MNEKLKEMALQAKPSPNLIWEDAELERFAELVLQNYISQIMTTEEREQFIRQDEREACAKLCEDGLPMGMGQTIGPIMCAAAIRARGNHGQN